LTQAVSPLSIAADAAAAAAAIVVGSE